MLSQTKLKNFKEAQPNSDQTTPHSQKLLHNDEVTNQLR